MLGQFLYSKRIFQIKELQDAFRPMQRILTDAESKLLNEITVIEDGANSFYYDKLYSLLNQEKLTK